MRQRIASCNCGKVRLALSGEPIITGVCYCDDCQAAAKLLEQMGAAPDFHDPWNGTSYATFRDDRLVWLEGDERLKPAKLNPGAPTTRFLASCCNTPMSLKFGPGWWTSVYRDRLGAEAPANEMRLQTRFVEDGAGLPTDLPRHRRFAAALIFRLLASRVAMAFGRKP